MLRSLSTTFHSEGLPLTDCGTRTGQCMYIRHPRSGEDLHAKLLSQRAQQMDNSGRVVGAGEDPAVALRLKRGSSASIWRELQPLLKPLEGLARSKRLAEGSHQLPCAAWIALQ